MINNPFNRPALGGTPFQPVALPRVRSTPVQQSGLPAAVRRLLEMPLESFRPPASTAGVAPVTHAALVLDESGSMGSHRFTALQGVNAQLSVIREGARDVGRTLVSLNQFSSSSRPVLVACPVDDLRFLDSSQYNPSGGTALFDALGQTIELLLEQPDIESPNTAVLVAVFTDGEENMSTRYDGATLKALVSRLERTGRWTFTLMGPQGSSLELASVLNLSRGNVAMFDPGSVQSAGAAFATMTGAASNYMTMRSAGLTACASLYADTDAKRP